MSKKKQKQQIEVDHQDFRFGIIKGYKTTVNFVYKKMENNFREQDTEQILET